jgi:sterol 3beta-glucosyltransferase
VIGNLHLTSHRLLFHALLPPDAALVRDRSSGTEPDSDQAPAASPLHSGVIQSCSIPVHRPGPLKQARRIELELCPDMIRALPRFAEGQSPLLRAISDVYE